MKYLGSKRRIVDEILPIMSQSLQPGMSFVDCFCGGCSVVQHVPQVYRRIANDNNRYLVAMWERLTTTNWQPPTHIPKSLYDDVRKTWHIEDGRYDDATVGWVGFMASRNGRFYDGGYSGHSCKGRDYIAENIRNISKQTGELKGVEWQCGSYDKMFIPTASLIYLDPPYKGTSTYSTARYFDYGQFYDWTRQMKRNGHTVFVSEYQMPGDFKPIWQKTITNRVNVSKTYKATETLWTI